MYPTIPEDRSGMTAAELRALAAELRAVALTELRKSHEPEVIELAKSAKDAADALEFEAGLIPEPVVATDTEPDDDDDDDDDEGEGVPQASAADAARGVLAVVETSTELDTTPSIVTPDEPQALKPDLVMRVDNSDGHKAGTPFDDWAELAEALSVRAKTVKRDSTERFEVGRIFGNYPAERQLTMDPFENLRILNTLTQYSGEMDEIRAALCAPFTPYYNLACMNTTRRPVAASLPGFAAPRGGVTIYPSPSLSDVDGSAGIWTREDDADDEAVKNECATITCADSEEFVMYGVYWCLTVKNMLALTFPELLAAYMNRGMANFARVAEIQLLDAMGSGVSTINMPDADYGALTTVTTQILHYLALYREQQRWDDVPMVGWGPRWLQVALQIDLGRRNVQGGGFTLASEATVNAAFASAGIDMTWYLDDPVWGEPVPAALATGGNPSVALLGTLAALPTSVDILVAPAGKFTMIDRAQLSIGVTGNNWYRDNTSNTRNEVTYFFENYEGVVDTTSCDAHILHWDDLCYNGAQIADVALSCTGVAA